MRLDPVVADRLTEAAEKEGFNLSQYLIFAGLAVATLNPHLINDGVAALVILHSKELFGNSLSSPKKERS
jgi:hypothetical protein